ncbi:uncharacterized protein [Parasteatoda tepidariorum]|uniref:uncharacterized protein isoform X1 n=2 Tax=Parasteatoda tepidariorum TaxID=114398 RepID=UPI0039BCFA44
MWKKMSQDSQDSKKCAKSKANRKFYGEKEVKSVKDTTKTQSGKGRVLVPLKIDFFRSPKKGVLKRSTHRKESTENDRRVSFNNETEVHYRTASEASSTSTLHSKIKITCKSTKTLKTGFKSTENNRSYGHSTFEYGSQSKKLELQNKFNMLLNGNCSWSYKSLKVINNHETNGEPNKSLIKNVQVTQQNKTNDSSNSTSDNRDATDNKDANAEKYRPGYGSTKRKFFDLDDNLPEVKHFAAENTYDFDEFDKTKTIKKPRKRAIKKKEKNGDAHQTKPKKVRPSRTKKKVDYLEWNSHSELSASEDDYRIKSKPKEQVNPSYLETENMHSKFRFEQEVGAIENKQIKLQPGDEVSPISLLSGTYNADEESECSDDEFDFQTRFSNKSANVPIENEQIKLQPGDKVSPTSLLSGSNNVDEKSECSDNEFVFQTRFSNKNTNKLIKNEQIKLQPGDKVSPVSLLSGANNADEESECSDDGFVFQTRFSDKNANVVDITNSIESNSIEASETKNAPLISKAVNKKEASKEMTVLRFPNEISSVDCSPQDIHINKLQESNCSSEGINSSLSPPELITDQLDLNMKTREVENELHNNEQFISLQDQLDEKCNKIDQEIREMYDKLEQDIFQGNKTKSISSADNSKLEKTDSNFKLKRPKMDANCEKYKLAKEKDYVKANASKLIDTKSEKLNLFKLNKKENTKYDKQSNDNKSINLLNWNETQYSIKKTDKNPFDPIESTPNINTHENLIKTKRHSKIFTQSNNDEFTSDEDYQLIENEINTSIPSSNSSEICSPELCPNNTLTKWSSNLGNISKRLKENLSNSENQRNIRNNSMEVQNNNNQYGKNNSEIKSDKISLKLENKFSAENNLKGINTKSIKHNASTKTLNNGETSAVFQKVLFSKVKSKENENKQQNYKSVTAKEDKVSKPKTWEDLESKLLMELDSNSDHEVYPQKDNSFTTPQRNSNVAEQKRYSDFEEEKKELKIRNLEISQYKKSKRAITSNKNQLHTKEHVSNQVSVLESPSVSILNKTIEAMNRSTAAYFSKNENGSFCNWSETSDVDIQDTEYSYSILSTTIHTSGKKLNLTKKRSRYIKKTNDDIKRNNLKSIEENTPLNKKIFSRTTKQVITSNCKATKNLNSTSETSVREKKASKKVDIAKKATKNRNKIESFSLILRNTRRVQDDLEENISISDNQDDSREDISKMEQDNSDSKYYPKQQYSSRKRKNVSDSNKKHTSNKKQNVSVLKEKQSTFFYNSANEDEALFSKDFFANGSQSERNSTNQLKNNETIKQLSPKEEYIKYLKHLFQNDTVRKTNTTGEICNIDQDMCQIKSDDGKFLMKEDDLFSISSDDFEKDETVCCFEASGLFNDVLNED